MPTAADLLSPAVVAIDRAMLQEIVAAYVDAADPPGTADPPRPDAALLIAAAPTTGDVAASLAREVLGPMLAGQVRRAWADLRAAGGPRRVFGLMRDGGLLADALGVACPEVDARRLWLSRRLCLLAALHAPDDAEGLANLLVRARGRPALVSEALAELGVAEEGVPSGLAADDPLDPARLHRLRDALATGARRRAASARIAAVRTGILRHLRIAGALDEPVLPLLDVGYAASIQTALSRLLAAEGIEVRPWGAYLVTTPGAVWALRAGGAVRGFLADFGAPGWFATDFLRHREVVEALFAPGDGPLLGHDTDGGPITGPPVLPAIQRVTAAAMRSEALATVAQMPHGTEPDADFVRRLCLRLLTVPTAGEVALLGPWIYDDPLAIGPPRRLADKWPTRRSPAPVEDPFTVT